MRTTRLRVRLDEVEPAVLRVVDVPASSTVDEVHFAIQAAMGFDDSHLYEVRAGDARYGSFDLEDDEIADARSVRLAQLPVSFLYTYDFGDSWSHSVDVLGPGGEEPGLVHGEGREPQDDIGGAPGYERALAADALRPFDRERISARVRRVVGRVPPGLQVVLDAIAGGVELTPQGRLPQGVTREVQQQRPGWHRMGSAGRPARREDDLRPLAALHHLVLETRLARIRNGVVTPTKAAADPTEVLRRTRAAFSPETFIGLVVDHVVTRLVVEGPLDVDDLVTELHVGLGRHWGRDGCPLTEDDMALVLAQNSSVLRGLGQIEDDALPERTWRAGPDAGSWLPRTALVVRESS